MNLVKLYTIHGSIWVDAKQLAGSKTLLTIRNKNGDKVSEAGRTAAAREKASYGVHRENLYASPALAEAAYARMLADMARRTTPEETQP